MPIIFRMAVRAYGMYESVYHVYARYSTMTKTICTLKSASCIYGIKEQGYAPMHIIWVAAGRRVSN